MIKVTDVTKYFDDFKVLDDISMHVRRGTIYGLIGPNGAGKTTIINHINGVLTPKCGEIKINGEPVFENEKVKQSVLNISDDWFYYSTFTIKEMARFYRDMYPAFSNERYEAIKGIFKLDEKRQIRKLSKGMKKQVAFWLSLSAMPDVLILDEPLDGLDPVMRKQVLNLVIADVADREMTVLVSSHNLRELEDICDWVGIIHQGRMILEKPLDDLKGSVHKYQLVIPAEKDDELEKTGNVLHISRTGSVRSVIIRGDADECDKKMQELAPSLCERISLTLEEVFIYELGGLGYDFTNILV
ncbi:MAG: ABC transporter ATP-binding protein [Oscillospiraceae bacterium]|nr:ABC transporter ATP-binding protein [Oscillospiraceae bacterium]